MGFCTPEVHDNGTEKTNALSKDRQFNLCIQSLSPTDLTKLDLYPHPEHVLEFSPHCVFRCKFTFAYSKGIQEFQLLSPMYGPKITSNS